MSKDFNDFQATLARIANEAGNPQNLMDAGNVVLNAAKLLCSGFIITSGELRGSLNLAMTQDKGEMVVHIGTNKQYAAYVEFGTGPKGAANHNGTSPDVPVVYRLTPWWIHESQIDPQAAATYHWQYIDTEDGRFYKVTGQQAHPYLYPAFADNADVIAEIVTKGLEEAAK